MHRCVGVRSHILRNLLRFVRKTPPLSPPIARLRGPGPVVLRRNYMEEACGNESIEIETKTDMKEDPEFEEGGTGSSVDVKKGMIGQGEESDDEVRLKPVPGGFTSEIFKIEIKNIPPYAGYKV